MTAICLHGHFYQPPRENPWLGRIEPQPTAAPWNDWNERIADESYAPNAAIGNFARLSFNVGPTLMTWLERERPEIFAAIREQDREGVRRFRGHGPAIAQAYNHMILPLAPARDKRTQIIWGRREFEHRFGRPPEGLWLPEMAVDTESLRIAAELGFRFVILHPTQARAWRPLGEETWRPIGGRGGGGGDGGGGGGSGNDYGSGSGGDVGGSEPERIDTTRPWRVNLPGGGNLAVFFYDDRLGVAVSFGDALSSPERFAEMLMGAAVAVEAPADPAALPRLVHLATDGETFGHHKKGGAEALAGALDAIEAAPGLELTVYGDFLERCPPQGEVLIAANTSWSCPHGVERWRSDCGCAGGREPGWSQAWRGPLRDALDWLRDSAAALFERRGAAFFVDPWAARDAWIDLVLDPSEWSVRRFLDEQGAPGVAPERVRAGLPLLELQRFAMLMYTSCGWFFDDPGDIETVQILQYAGRVVQLAAAHLDTDLEPGLLTGLEAVVSNDPQRGDGRRIWQTRVRPYIDSHPVR